MVLMKGFRWESLYLLQGIIVTSSVGVWTTSTDVDTIRLWHMQLGHMSEKGMTILTKKGCLGSAGTSTLEFCDHCVFRK